MIILENVSKIYKGDTYNINAVDDISLKINEGDFIAFMGKSGSGKTTLLNIIAALEKPSKGKCIIDDVETNGLGMLKMDRLRRDKVGVVFQHFALVDEFSVFENVELVTDALNMKRKEKNEKIKDALKKLGIYDLRSKLPRKISGGEKQRTAIARVLVKDSKYIIADEPTGALDSENATNIMKIFKQLNEEGKTIIIATHDKDIASYANKIITISNGKIEEG
ncbi:MAG: ABC transporter ATP-binding protein [Eubacterium sp.]|nr:ABC transporter ATP-binding protein [Eubacterium sp.]